ncbi:hypothetical protein M231_04377 [Tremella mesenterica]|uniref:Uncharacterized protein n=1 Tax=Tremella mesenterica TaxID=5217 RepID=A0A4Q1BKQ0_TREME|nr:hypothetical protein M231_04377 [Tremella mesenterica]
MSVRSILSACAILLGFANIASAVMGNVESINGPSVVIVGSNLPTVVNFTQIRFTEQNDYGIIWGLVSPDEGCTQCVGRRLTFTDLFAIQGDFVASRIFDLPIPSDTPRGNYTLTAAVLDDEFPEGLVDIRYYTHPLIVDGPITSATSTVASTPTPPSTN